MGKIMKKTSVILCVLLLVSILAGCFNNTHNYLNNDSSYYYNNYEGNDKMYQLNERQIKICEQLELPTNYEELNEEQQISIERIEELLQYLDNKYGVIFVYKGYSDGGLLENEWLEAYSENLNEYYSTKLFVDENGNYSDDYAEIIASIILSDDLEEYLNVNLDNKFKVFASDCRAINEIIAKDVSDLKNVCSGTFSVIVKGKNNANLVREYADELVEWYKDRGIYGYTNFILVSDEYFEEVNISNYSHVKIDDDTEISLSCDISSDGEVRIY